MTVEPYNAKQKQVYFKAYAHLFLLENALKHIEEDVPNFQISVLGKVAQFYLDKDIEVSKNSDPIRTYWEKTCNNTIAYGCLYNPQIGNIFIVGNLAPTFLYKIDDKTLGMLSAGPYGILRGIGANEIQVSTHLKMLDNGNYILIFRGVKADLEKYKILLEENEK
ncbi:hypothetical protein JM83_3551 [Gillisia sp. Hel_I_86]|uniref:hypothetical protein n=1 Tax=Gillisia sp. Hel_I_86 TaxID=1249981 RepID=UPI00119B5036|nr:hypothetical protein [Gillisia sp. Hel_I_86]TVZ28424.1 hypothetical protein JM83_3551 [Gillisia sp. Hel_I_86]